MLFVKGVQWGMQLTSQVLKSPKVIYYHSNFELKELKFLDNTWKLGKDLNMP